MPETESMPTQGPAATAGPIFANILCAISGKEGGFAAVEQAAALAGTQGHLTFLAVTSFRSGGARRGPALGPESPSKRDRPREQEGTLQEQERMLERTRTSGATELLLKPGRAGVVVVSAATAADASLVVMGSRRLEGVRAMGSVSRRVVHQ